MPRAALGLDSTSKLEAGAIHVQGDHNGRRYHFQIFAASNEDYNADAILYRMVPDLDAQKEMLAKLDSNIVTIKVYTVGEMIGQPNKEVGAADASWARLATEADNAQWQDVDAGVSIPKLFANWHLSGDEDSFWTFMDSDALAFIRQMCGNSPELRVRGTKRDTLSSTFHEAGTLWMGEDPQSSVTNPEGRFHHVKNLYGIDQAIFPTVGSANPALTGLALSRMIVEKVLAQDGLRAPIFDDIVREESLSFIAQPMSSSAETLSSFVEPRSIVTEPTMPCDIDLEEELKKFNRKAPWNR